MSVYYTVTLIGVGFAVLAQLYEPTGRYSLPAAMRTSKIDWRVWVMLSFLPFFLCMGFRYFVGTDYWFTYLPMFQQMEAGMHAAPDWDLAYWLMFKLCSILFDTPTSVFVVSSLLILGFLWYGIWKVSPMPWFSILIFVVSRQFFISLNGVRQATALAIVAAALPFVADKSFWKYAVMVVLAGLCHASAFMFLPLYFLIYIPVDAISGFGFVVLASFCGGPISDMVRKMVANTKYGVYIGSRFDDGVRYLDYNLLCIAVTFLLAAAIISRYPIKKEESLLRFLFNMNVLSLFLAFNLNIVPNGDRLCWSFDFFCIFLIPALVKRLENRWQKWVVIMVITAIFGYVMWKRITIGDHGVLPYYNVFFPEKGIR